jgi:single-strand DNA-binding protein
MASVNRVILLGNLTRDPELTYLPSQTAVCNFGMAMNRKWKGQDGQEKEEVCFVDVVAFSKSAETISKYVKKGQLFYVEGRLKLDSWEAQDGSKRNKLKVIAELFQFIPTGQTRPTPQGEGQEPEYDGQPTNPVSDEIPF